MTSLSIDVTTFSCWQQAVEGKFVVCEEVSTSLRGGRREDKCSIRHLRNVFKFAERDRLQKTCRQKKLHKTTLPSRINN